MNDDLQWREVYPSQVILSNKSMVSSDFASFFQSNSLSALTIGSSRILTGYAFAVRYFTQSAVLTCSVFQLRCDPRARLINSAKQTYLHCHLRWRRYSQNSGRTSLPRAAQALDYRQKYTVVFHPIAKHFGRDHYNWPRTLQR